ncbi:MAG: ATP-binding cassette domain-containing protein [Blautia sp.]|nr:ATP-binding cassette domain-containing protein [Blautia sp.]MCM1201152.1 ATP-binding cassette domain-containing protein [Bacteroides fragilis]
MAETVIFASHLKKYFKEVRAVDDISFEIKKGELFGFLGINGAGKSTTINMLSTLSRPTDGKAEICGHPLGREDEQIRRRIGVVYQNNCLDEKLSVKENLFVRGSLYEKNRSRLKSRILNVCEILKLGDIYDRRFEKLSGGQKRRCEIARALVNRPEILFLDEPTTGLDPATRKNVWQSVEQLRKEMNMTVFLTTHYMEEAAKATGIAIIDGGHIMERGTPFALKEKYAKDRLVLRPEEGQEERFWETLKEEKADCRRKEGYAAVEIENSMLALPILRRMQPFLEGFELVQGSMDDVFLNVTGKTLGRSEG